MEKELLTSVLTIFDTPEKWNSYVDLIKLNDSIQRFWINKLKSAMKKTFVSSDIWRVEFYLDWDARWYLKQIEFTKLNFWLCNHGNFHFVIPNIGGESVEKIRKIFDQPKYSSLRFLWSVDIEKNINNEIFIRSKGKWIFDSIYDGDFSKERLVWYAGNKTEEFLNQIKNKVSAFQNEEIVSLLIELDNEIESNLKLKG